MPESADVTDEVLERRHRKCLVCSIGSPIVPLPSGFPRLMVALSNSSPMLGLLSSGSAGSLDVPFNCSSLGSLVVPLSTSSLGSLENPITTGFGLPGAGTSSCLKSPCLIFSDTFNFATLSPSSVKPGSGASGYGAAIPWIGERWDQTGARRAWLGARSTGNAGAQVGGRRPIMHRWRGPGQ